MNTDFQLSQYIKNVFLQFKINSVGHPSILLLDEEVADALKQITRYSALMYGLAAFYVQMNGTESQRLIICNKQILRQEYQLYYDKQCFFTKEDAEPVLPCPLYSNFSKIEKKLPIKEKRGLLGLPTSDGNRPCLTLKSATVEEQFSEAASSASARTENDFFSGESTASFVTTAQSVTTLKNEPSNQGNAVSAIVAAFFTLNVDAQEFVPQKNVYFKNKTVPKVPRKPLPNYSHSTLNVDAQEFAPQTNVYSENKTVPKVPRKPLPNYSHSTLNVDAQEFAPQTNVYSENKTVPKVPQKPSPNSTANKVFGNHYEFTQKLKQYFVNQPVIFLAENQDYILKFGRFYECLINNVVEAYNIPETYRTLALLQCFHDKPVKVKWCDKSHALIIFANAAHVRSIRVSPGECEVRLMTKASATALTIASLLDLPAIINSMGST